MGKTIEGNTGEKKLEISTELAIAVLENENRMMKERINELKERLEESNGLLKMYRSKAATLETIVKSVAATCNLLNDGK